MYIFYQPPAKTIFFKSLLAVSITSFKEIVEIGSDEYDKFPCAVSFKPILNTLPRKGKDAAILLTAGESVGSIAYSWLNAQ